MEKPGSPGLGSRPTAKSQLTGSLSLGRPTAGKPLDARKQGQGQHSRASHRCERGHLCHL